MAAGYQHLDIKQLASFPAFFACPTKRRDLELGRALGFWKGSGRRSRFEVDFGVSHSHSHSHSILGDWDSFTYTRLGGYSLTWWGYIHPHSGVQ